MPILPYAGYNAKLKKKLYFFIVTTLYSNPHKETAEGYLIDDRRRKKNDGFV